MWDFETSVTIGLMAISGTLALSCLYIMGWLIKHRDRPSVKALNGLWTPGLVIVGLTIRAVIIMPVRFEYCGTYAALNNICVLIVHGAFTCQMYTMWCHYRKMESPSRLSLALFKALPVVGVAPAIFEYMFLETDPVITPGRPNTACFSASDWTNNLGSVVVIYWILVWLWMIPAKMWPLRKKADLVPQYYGLVLSAIVIMSAAALDQVIFGLAHGSVAIINLLSIILIGLWGSSYARPYIYRDNAAFNLYYNFGLTIAATSKTMIQRALKEWSENKDIVLGFDSLENPIFPRKNSSMYRDILIRDAQSDYTTRILHTLIILEKYCRTTFTTSLRSSTVQRLLKKADLASDGFFRSTKQELLSHMYAVQVVENNGSIEAAYLAELSAKYIPILRIPDERSIFNFTKGENITEDTLANPRPLPEAQNWVTKLYSFLCVRSTTGLDEQSLVPHPQPIPVSEASSHKSLKSSAPSTSKLSPDVAEAPSLRTPQT